MWKLLVPIIVLALGTPAWAQSTTVLGSSDGYLCFMETKTGLSPGTAVRTCSRALSQGFLSRKDRAYTYVNRSINYNLIGEFEKALDDINKAFEIIPDLPEAFLSRGNNSFFQKRYEDAMADYNKSLELNLKDDHAAYYNRAMALEALKRYEEAYADLLLAVEAKSNFKLALDRIQVYKDEFDWIE